MSMQMFDIRCGAAKKTKSQNPSFKLSVLGLAAVFLFFIFEHYRGH
jgi:hypothetical protein